MVKLISIELYTIEEILKNNYEEGQINSGLASVSVSELDTISRSGLADETLWSIQGYLVDSNWVKNQRNG